MDFDIFEKYTDNNTYSTIYGTYGTLGMKYFHKFSDTERVEIMNNILDMYDTDIDLQDKTIIPTQFNIGDPEFYYYIRKKYFCKDNIDDHLTSILNNSFATWEELKNVMNQVTSNELNMMLSKFTTLGIPLTKNEVALYFETIPTMTNNEYKNLLNITNENYQQHVNTLKDVFGSITDIKQKLVQTTSYIGAKYTEQGVAEGLTYYFNISKLTDIEVDNLLNVLEADVNISRDDFIDRDLTHISVRLTNNEIKYYKLYFR